MTHSFGATGEAAELPLGLQPAQAVLAALSLGDLGGNPHPGAPDQATWLTKLSR